MIQHKRFVMLMLAGFCLVPLSTVFAQMGGSRGGVIRTSGTARAVEGLQTLAPDVAQGYITVEGRVELRVKPTEIRIVLALTSEGSGPAECKRSVSKKAETLVAAWVQMGIPRENIVEDFIAVLPRYDFEIEKIRDRDVAVEKQVGFVMQSNMHVAVKDDAQAMGAISIAFEQNVADVIAFDYWSAELDKMKVQARAEAVKTARAKADTLLGALFEKRPPMINVQESTRVVYPEVLYESFTNTNEGSYRTTYARGAIPEIRMFRPKNTYYRGLYLDADVQSKELPMRSEISIISTVRLYFESPSSRKQASKAAEK